MASNSPIAISAGNAGQAVAYAARAAGIPCSVVAIETAPQTKLDRMRALGANIVPVSYDRAWVAAETHEFPGLDSTFVHPFDNHDFIAGHGTMGLEIFEDCPEVRTVICAIGGGGSSSGACTAAPGMLAATIGRQRGKGSPARPSSPTFASSSREAARLSGDSSRAPAIWRRTSSADAAGSPVQ